MKHPLTRFATTLVGVGLVVALGASRASAQDASDADTSENDVMAVPAPLDYPFASPGGLNLIHYTDYRKINTAPGSAHDTMIKKAKMMEQMRMDMVARDQKTYGAYMKNPDRDDKTMADPAPLGYPFASPGGLAVLAFSDYTMTDFVVGATPAQVKMMREKQQEEMRMDRERMDQMRYGNVVMSDYEKRMMADPAPMSYPMAAPGSLPLFHFTDYTMTDTMPGSVNEHRAERDKMMEEKRQQDMKRTRQVKPAK